MSHNHRYPALIICFLACSAFCLNAQVISSLNEQNTKIAPAQKVEPKKQTQFSAQKGGEVNIDTTPYITHMWILLKNISKTKIGVMLNIL